MAAVHMGPRVRLAAGSCGIYTALQSPPRGRSTYTGALAFAQKGRYYGYGIGWIVKVGNIFSWIQRHKIYAQHLKCQCMHIPFLCICVGDAHFMYEFFLSLSIFSFFSSSCCPVPASALVVCIARHQRSIYEFLCRFFLIFIL